MAVKRINDTSQRNSSQRPKLKEGIVKQGERVPLFSTQGSSEILGRRPEASRDPVGPAFPTPLLPIVGSDNKTRRSGPVRRWINGITSGNNHCYRNAVLTAFLSLRTVVDRLTYWSKNSRRKKHAMGKDGMVAKLVHIHKVLFLWRAKQTTIDNTVGQFWQRFCYQNDAGKDSTATRAVETWQRRLGDDDCLQENSQQDASEFLAWILDRLSEQHMLPGLDFLFASQFGQRTLCEKCQYRVQRRIVREVEQETGKTPLPETETQLLLNVPCVSDSHSSHGPDAQLELTTLIDNAFRTEVRKRCPRCKKTSDCVNTQRL